MVATVQKFYYEALKTLKILWFSILFQWTNGQWLHFNIELALATYSSTV